MVSKDLKQVEVWNSSGFHHLFRIYEILTCERVKEKLYLFSYFATPPLVSSAMVECRSFDTPFPKSENAF